MTTKSQALSATVLLMALLLMALLLALLLTSDTWLPSTRAPVATPGSDARTNHASTQHGNPATATTTDNTPTSERDAVAVPPAESHVTGGTISVRTVYADDQSPAQQVLVLAWPSGTAAALTARRMRTTLDGMAVFEDVPAGGMVVATFPNIGRAKRVTVHNGKTTDVTFELSGVTVAGIVVDAAMAPIANASIEAKPPFRGQPEQIASSGPDGRFRVRACRMPLSIAARAVGFAASDALDVAQEDQPDELVIMLSGFGGTVSGIVSGGNGPVAQAVVQVGEQTRSSLKREPPFPAITRTDQEGRFRVVGVPVGQQALRVRAAGFAPFADTCEVTATNNTIVHVRLQRGATIRGIVLGPDDTPAAKATIRVGTDTEILAELATRSAADGSFTLPDLPAGETTVQASHQQLGKVSRTVVTTAATTTTCDLQLSRGLELQGRVLREDNTPVAAAHVTCSWPGQMMLRVTDALGRFTISNCPEQAISFRVQAEGTQLLIQPGIDPRAGDVTLRVKSIGRPSAKLTGSVVTPDNTPLANIEVLAGRAGQSVLNRLTATTAADGSFTFDPLVPGSWYLTIATENYPRYQSGPHKLAVDAHQELGTIRLAAGGTLRARIESGDASGVQFRARRQDGGATQGVLDLRANHVESPLLRPGAYNLLIYGNGCAEQTVPFTIRANEQTDLSLALQSGVLQRFEVTAPDLATDSLTVQLVIRRSDQLVRELTVRAVTQNGRTAKIWLTPGSYTLVASSGTRVATVPFAVGSEEAPALPVQVR